MGFFEKVQFRSKQDWNEYLLNSQEMQVFYTLPLDERQAVLDRISGHAKRKKGSGSISK